MTKLEDYVYRYCSRELAEAKRQSPDLESKLSFEERALIYKYTEDGYEELNKKLRVSKGQNYTDFGRYLDKTLRKLPDCQDITYRSANLSITELQKYLDAHANNSILVEHSFISTSKSKAIAYAFGSNFHFRIMSRSGKDIELFAKYGTGNPQNEKEVLFRANRKFKVLEVTKQDQNTLITLEEVK